MMRDYYISGNIQFKSRIIAEHKDDAENELDGLATWYDERGNVKQTQEYKAGVRHGKLTDFYEGGRVQMVRTFRQNVEHGTRTEYYKSGKIGYVGRYVNGLLEGEATHYNEDGSRSAIYKNSAGVLTEVKLFWDDGKGYNLVYNPIHNAKTNSYDGEHHRYTNKGEKIDVVRIKNNEIVATIWKQPATYARSKEWQTALKKGVRFFEGTWYGEAQSPAASTGPTTYGLDIVKSRYGNYYLWRVTNNLMGSQHSYCSRGYAREIGFRGEENYFADVTEIKHEEGEVAGAIELCGTLYGGSDCRVVFGYNEIRGWHTVTRNQFVNIRKIR